MRIGSLFSGYGGLEMGVQSVLGGTTAWHCEYEPPTKAHPNPSQAAAKILAHHWPDVPNLGDITKVDWSHVEPVDVITGGSPCQDVSAAGRRAGMKAGTRSGLWASMVDAIDALRPRLVVWENVRGVTSAHADSDMAAGSGLLGPTDGGPYLRALGRVLGDLSDIGYDARWYGLRAADVGAPHGRFRVFVVASDTDGLAGQTVGAFGWRPGTVGQPGTVERTVRPDSAHPATHSDGHALREQPIGEPGGSREAVAGLAGANATADTDSAGRGRVAELDSDQTTGINSQHRRHADRRDDGFSWGAYTGAIRRWEHISGRPAPRPTEPNARGTGQRLSPAFVEWMMGIPAGHVTAVPGISRNEQLKALGNGVVPQQAAAAVRLLLQASAVAA